MSNHDGGSSSYSVEILVGLKRNLSPNSNAIGPAGAYLPISSLIYLAPGLFISITTGCKSVANTSYMYAQRAMPFDPVTFSLRLIEFILVMVSATSLANIQFDDALTLSIGLWWSTGKTISESVLECLASRAPRLFYFHCSFLD